MAAIETTDWVYLIEAVGHNMVKIGHSKDPDSRLKSLSSASPFGLQLLAKIPGGKSREMELHKRFSQYRAKGEWFLDVPCIRKFFDSPKAKKNDPFNKGDMEEENNGEIHDWEVKRFLSFGRFSWIVSKHEGPGVQVRANFCNVVNGCLVFKSGKEELKEEENHTVVSFAAGVWKECKIISMFDGSPTHVMRLES